MPNAPDTNGNSRIDGVKVTPEMMAVHIQDLTKDVEDVKDQITGVARQVSGVKDQISGNLEAVRSMMLALDERYVRKEEFNPIKNGVYSLVGVVMLMVVGGLLALVIRTAP